MSGKPPNETWKLQNKKLVRSTFKKAFITAIYSSSSTVDVFFAENPQTVIRNIPLAANVDPRLIMVGDRCRVDVFDETNPNDMVVAYVYGRSFGFTTVASKVFWNAGTGVMSNGGSNTLLIPHGLVDNNGVPLIPSIYNVGISSDPVYNPTNTTYTLGVAGVDATNITVGRNPDNVISISYFWFVMKIVP